MAKCSLCDVDLTDENDSYEHIIPNSIGGRREIKGFICVQCNSTAGQEWESVLAEQLHSLSLFFRVSRARGDVPAKVLETADGRRVEYHSSAPMTIADPTYSATHRENDSVQINISARSIKEAKKMLAGVKRKYPKADIQSALAKAEMKREYLDSMIKIGATFGGPRSGRSVVKTALAQAVDAGIDPSTCEVAQRYLRNLNGEACFGYYYQGELIQNRPEAVPLHCVSVHADSQRKQLLAYVEYFGVQRMVILLSEDYCGVDFTKTYSIDPRTGEEINLKCCLSMPREEVEAIFRYERCPNGSVEAAFNQVIPTAMRNAFALEGQRVTQEAIAYAFANCGAAEGENLTEAHISKIAKLVTEKLAPFILHQMRTFQPRLKLPIPNEDEESLSTGKH
jgi:hypothetical protein